MNEREFCYWLQGFFELNGEDLVDLSAEQVRMIKDHLNLVFKKVTPDIKHTYCSPQPDIYFPLNTAHTGITSVATC
jgi:hypothetical protein